MISVRALFRKSSYSRVISGDTTSIISRFFEPELDDMEKWLVALHAATEGLGAPAFAYPDRLDLLRFQRHRERDMERPHSGGVGLSPNTTQKYSTAPARADERGLGKENSRP